MQSNYFLIKSLTVVVATLLLVDISIGKKIVLLFIFFFLFAINYFKL